jgi:hypothetical protein
MLCRLLAFRRLVHSQYNFLRSDYWFGQVDSRPLSLFRICFAVLLLKNALYSIPVAQLFYSDGGIVPRAQFWDDPTQVGLDQFSLLNYLSASWMAILFFAVWSGIILALLLGYQTRLMTVLNYLCRLSFVQRNSFPLSGADHVMTVLSFWMIFLPLNHDYSIDAWLARRHSLAVQAGKGASPAMPHTTYAFPLRVIQLQVALIYVFTSYMKWQGIPWRDGSALYYTFQQIGYLLPTGIWLGVHAPMWLLRLLTWSTLLIEVGFVPLVFAPVLQPWARASGLLLAALMHLGIALTMAIPDFSLVMWISYILFFEPAWVAWLERQLCRRLKRPPTPVVRSEAVVLPEGKRRWPPLGQVVLTIVLTALLITTIWGSLEQGRRLNTRLVPPMPTFVKPIDRQLHLASAWKMFVYPVIPRMGWLMIQGHFENGENTLLYTGADPATGQMYREWGPGARLRLLEQHLLTSFPSTILNAWGGYYCQLFNGEQNRPIGMRLATLEIHLHYRLSHLPGAPPNPYEDDLLWRHQCLIK